MFVSVRRIILLMLCCSTIASAELGGWSISSELFQFICDNWQAGSTILELGSGEGTAQLAEYFTMYSVEHNKA